MSNLQLWVEKYRPSDMNSYVWNDDNQRKKVEEWIKEGALPHLIFSGSPGVGKTSLAKLLLRELKIPSGDIMEINASRERRVEDIQERFQSFVNTWALGEFGIKYILFDEADSMSPLSQRMLRGDLETYSDVCRVIFTCVTGDAKIYTPNGWIFADKIKKGNLVYTGVGSVGENKAVKKSISKKIININSMHGYNISVTPEHQFLNGKKWFIANELAIGDRIEIDLISQFGNEYNSEEDLGKPILDRKKFEEYLIENRICFPAEVKKEVSELQYFISPCYMEWMKNSNNQITILSLCDRLNVNKHIARNILNRSVKTKIVEKFTGLNGEITYKADWKKFMILSYNNGKLYLKNII